MRKQKPLKAWTAYRLARVGKRLGTVYGEALVNAQKEFATSEVERKRIYLRAQLPPC
jgi:hypothetical protein